MTDLTRAMRETAASVAAATVAPPFARVERRRRARRTRRLALASVAMVAAGGIAVAAPGGLTRTPLGPAAPSASLRPFEDYLRDEKAQEEVQECVRQRLMVVADYGVVYRECLARSGYAYGESSRPLPLPGGTDPGGRRDSCAAEIRATQPVARGTARGGEWLLRARDADGQTCLVVTYAGETHWGFADSARPYTSVLPLRHGELLVYGRTDAGVATVNIVVDGRTYTARTVRIPETSSLAYAVVVALDGSPGRFTATDRDTSGRQVGSPRSGLLNGAHCFEVPSSCLEAFEP